MSAPPKTTPRCTVRAPVTPPAALKQFDVARRRQISELAAQHSRICDLAETFPGLLFALASGYGTSAARRQALQQIRAGKPLRHVAKTIDLPYWLRRLPAAAFTFDLHQLPIEPAHAKKLAGHIPPAPSAAKIWFWGIHYATCAGGPDFAIWVSDQIARHPTRFRGVTGRSHLRRLTAWAWHSGQPGSPGFDLLAKPWSPDMGYKRAHEECARWLCRVDLARVLARRNLKGHKPWVAAGASQGHTFRELTSILDFMRESEAMDNCLDQFAQQLASRDSQVFSVEVKGRTVADVEIGRHDAEPTMPAVLQLRGQRNRRASARVWQATYAWLGEQRLAMRRVTHKAAGRPQVDRHFNRTFWEPYITALATARIPEAMLNDIVLTFELEKCGLGTRPTPRQRTQKATPAASNMIGGRKAGPTMVAKAKTAVPAAKAQTAATPPTKRLDSDTQKSKPKPLASESTACRAK
ncbi:MAG: hypothetical protein AAGG72_08840 [Pseudomonadota bacterium]